MSQLSASDLATALGVSKARVSQLTADRRLDGCWQGEGRARRYDLQKVAAKLGRVLDPGQALGNGAATKARIQSILAAGDDEDAETPMPKPQPRESAELPQRDADRYELARIQKAEEEARRMRRQNQEAEGHFVLASEVRAETARRMAQEIAQFEVVLREGARAVADRLGVDAKVCRKILMDEWRRHRGERSAALEAEGAGAGMTEAEKQADV